MHDIFNILFLDILANPIPLLLNIFSLVHTLFAHNPQFNNAVWVYLLTRGRAVVVVRWFVCLSDLSLLSDLVATAVRL